jgi:hypothetical protein
VPRGRGAAFRSPFVGRDAELERFGAALERAAQGQGSVLRLRGEPGIGKTRLVLPGPRLVLTAGLIYDREAGLNFFNAERHPSGSNFKITTPMTFVDCGISPVVK